MSRISPDEVVELAAGELLELNAELAADSRGRADVFYRLGGITREDLAQASDRAFALLPSTLPGPAEDQAVGTDTMMLEVAVIYGLTTDGLRRMLRDAQRIGDALRRLIYHPAVQRVTVYPGEPEYDDAGQTVVAPWAIEIAYYGADLRRPRVEVTSPRALATGVGVDAAVELRFSEPMTTGSFLPALVDQAGASVAHTAIWSSGDRVVTLTPTAPLAGGVIYVCTVSRGATSAAGHPIREAHELRFATQE